MDRPTLYAVSAGHFIVDMCQGIVPVMLPLLMTRLDLNYAQAGLVVTAGYLTSSVTQPLFGLIRHPGVQRYAMPCGVFLACLLLILAGNAPSYPVLLLSVIVSSAGVAMYHPEAAATANRASGTVHKSKGMSVFAMCGSVGFTFGPLVFGPLLAWLGMPGIWFLLLPALLFPALLMRFARPAALPPAPSRPTESRVSTAARPRTFAPALAMTLLIAVVACARWASAGTMTFLPLYFERFLGLAPAVGNRAMIAFQVGGDIGTIGCGLLVARFGVKRTLVAGMIAATPLLLAFYQVTGTATLALLFLANFMLALTVLSTTLLGQEYLSTNKALAASLTLGFANGIGGLGSGFLGRVADTRGMLTALFFVAIAPMIGAVISFFLPDRKEESA